MVVFISRLDDGNNSLLKVVQEVVICLDVEPLKSLIILFLQIQLSEQGLLFHGDQLAEQKNYGFVRLITLNFIYSLLYVFANLLGFNLLLGLLTEKASQVDAFEVVCINHIFFVHINRVNLRGDPLNNALGGHSTFYMLV